MCACIDLCPYTYIYEQYLLEEKSDVHRAAIQSLARSLSAWLHTDNWRRRVLSSSRRVASSCDREISNFFEILLVSSRCLFRRWNVRKTARAILYTEIMLTTYIFTQMNYICVQFLTFSSRHDVRPYMYHVTIDDQRRPSLPRSQHRWRTCAREHDRRVETSSRIAVISFHIVTTIHLFGEIWLMTNIERYTSYSHIINSSLVNERVLRFMYSVREELHGFPMANPDRISASWDFCVDTRDPSHEIRELFTSWLCASWHTYLCELVGVRLTDEISFVVTAPFSARAGALSHYYCYYYSRRKLLSQGWFAVLYICHDVEFLKI